MTLLQIENRYCCRLKILEPQVDRLKNKHLEDFKALELQQMSRQWDNLLCNLLHVQPIKMIQLWDCFIE